MLTSFYLLVLAHSVMGLTNFIPGVLGMNDFFLNFVLFLTYGLYHTFFSRVTGKKYH